MFNAVTIQDAFISLVGWRNDSAPGTTQPPMGDLLTASSGLYFNDLHPYLTIETLKSICDVFEDYTYDPWSGGGSYNKGDIVTYNGSFWIFTQTSIVSHTPGDDEYWRETNPFNEWLRNKVLAGINKCMNDWFQTKGEMRTASNLLKRSQVLMIPNYKNENVSSTKNWLGWRVCPIPQRGVVMTIDRISIHLRESETISINLYKNGVFSKTTSITGNATSDILWKDVYWELEPECTYYVAFDKTSVTTDVVNDIANMDRQNWSWNRFPGTLPFAEVSAFEHDGPGESGWNDVVDIQTNQNNFGLNMMISAKCDYTELLVDQKSLFANPILRAVGMMLLRELAYNPKARINRLENNIDKSRLLFEIDGDTLGRSGSIRKDYDNNIKSVLFDNKQFSEHCLPCKKSTIRQFAT